MNKTTLQYKVFVTPDVQTGTKKPGYTAYVPKLGISDDGFTVEEVLKNIQSLISFHLENLICENSPIPASDSDKSLVTTTSVEVPVAVDYLCD